jgi:hypothetical protein
MSIETLKADLNDITASASAHALEEKAGAAPPVWGWLRDNLLPWIQGMADEVEEMDEAIHDVVNQSVDVLHPESAEVFAAIIAAGATMAAELRTRVGDDRRLLKSISEYIALLGRGKELLEDIYISDDDDDGEDDEGDDEGADDAGAELAPLPIAQVVKGGGQ